MSSAKPRMLDPEVLKANAIRSMREDTRYNFTQAEISAMKDRLFIVARSLAARSELTRKMKSILDEMASADAVNEIHIAVSESERDLGDHGTKELGQEHSILIKKIRDGYEIKNVLVYEIEGEDPSILEYYSEDGAFLYDRRVAGARQLNIISSIAKTGTTDGE